IEVDVLPSRQLRMEAGPHFQQAADATVQRDASFAGRRDSAENLQQRRLARAVAADDPDHVAGLDLKRNVLQRPELFVPVPAMSISVAAAQTTDGSGG